MKNVIRRHFPRTRAKFWIYFKTFLPLIIGSTLFALNGVVDNFMVGQIDQGVSALAVVNQWTAILIGWFIASAAAGSVVMAQFYHDKQYDVVKQISRYRFFLSSLITIPFFAISWANPDLLINAFFKPGDNKNVNDQIYQNAREYMQVISFQWIIFAYSFNLGNQLRELGYTRHPMLWGIGTLTLNIFLNSILLYVVKMGVRGAAIASVAARVLAFVWGTVYIKYRALPISYNLIGMISVPWKNQRLFWGRWQYFMSIFTVMVFINFRTSFWANAFPPGTIGIGIGSLAVLGLTTALMNVFTTTFSSLAAMAANFVASEFGKGNIEQGRKNSDELKGFNFLMSFSLALLMMIFAAIVPYLNFLSQDQYEDGIKTYDSAAQLIQVRNSLFVLGSFYPMWIWFTTSYRNGNAGGKGWYFSAVDWISSGPVQLGWIALLTTVIIPNSDVLQNNFALSYALFFFSDILKLILQETYYYKSKYWMHSITRNQSEFSLASSQTISEDIVTRD